MIKLDQYINENARTTQTNVERKEELEKWLKNKKYTDYVSTLNKMLDDPKAKTLLVDGFGGELGKTKFTFKVKNIPASNLRPTQSEIDVDKSLKHFLTNPENIKKDFQNEIVIANMPLVTFRGNYVIDGHHRWSEVAIVNPEGKMVCFDYDADISPVQMLKAVQGSIAAVMVERDKDEKIPQKIVSGPNLYDKKWDKTAIEEYVDKYITDEVKSLCYEYFDSCTSLEDIKSIISENAMDIKYNNYPEDNAPNRGNMPQTDKAGHEQGNKKTAYPTERGSALNKMKDGKFIKSAIK